MNRTVVIRLKRAEGSLVRLLGLVGRRGYDVRGLEARTSADGKAFDVRLEFGSIYPEGKPGYRPPDVLVRMIAKLYDVERVDLLDGAPSNGAPAGGA